MSTNATQAQAVRRQPGAPLTLKSFYRWSLLLPLVLPLIAAAMLRSGVATDLGAMVLFTLMMSLVYGGVPYLLLTAGLLWWSRDKSAAEFRRVAYWSPLFLVPIFTICLVVYLLVEGSLELGWTAAWTFGFFALYILIIGYVYVLAVDYAAIMLRRRGVLT